MIEKRNKEFKKLKTFSQLKIEKIAQINKIIDKGTKIFDNLITDLRRATNPLSPKLNFDFYKENKIFHKTHSALINETSTLNNNMNRLKLNLKKSIKKDFSSYIKNSSSINTSFNKDKTKDKKNKIKYSFKSSLNDKKIHYNKINPINMKKNNFLISNKDKEKNEKYLFEKKLNHTHKFSFNSDDSKNNKYSIFYNSKNDYNNQQTFITQQTPHKQTHNKKISLFDKIKRDNFNLRKLRTQQSFFKKMTKNVLIDCINDSSNIFNEQYNKFIEEEETISSTIKTIKKNLEKSANRKSLKNKLNSFIIEDIDIPKIRKNMRLFKNSKKQKISFKSTDLFKSRMITKKVADIINCWDTLSKINDIYFYKNQKAFKKIYPTLSTKATQDPFKKDYSKLFIKK